MDGLTPAHRLEEWLGGLRNAPTASSCCRESRAAKRAKAVAPPVPGKPRAATVTAGTVFNGWRLPRPWRHSGTSPRHWNRLRSRGPVIGSRCCSAFPLAGVSTRLSARAALRGPAAVGYAARREVGRKVAMKADKRRRPDEAGAQEAVERPDTPARARVEHPFRSVQYHLGYAKVR